MTFKQLPELAQKFVLLIVMLIAVLITLLISMGTSSYALAQQSEAELDASMQAQSSNMSETDSDEDRLPAKKEIDWGPIKKGLVLYVRSPYAEMHTFAGRSYPIFHVIEKNEPIIVYKQRNSWYKVRTSDGKVGWVKRQQLVGTQDENGLTLSLKKARWQDYLDNDFRMTLVVGKFENIISYSPSIGYNFTRNISAELRLSQAFGDVSTLKYASLNLMHQPMPHWRISPFFLLGAGAIKTDPISVTADTIDRQDSLITVGGGTNIQLNKTLSLRLEYNNHTILTNRSENEEVEEWKAGFSVLF